MKQTLFIIGLIATAMLPNALPALDEIDQDSSDYHPGLIIGDDLSGEPRTLKVSLKARGISRLKMGFCNFAQLFVRFESDDLANTPFAGQQILPLVTHCKKSGRYEQYLLKEFLAYQTYGRLTDASIRTRLAKITYVDTSGKRKELVRHAFFAEHFDQVARRLDRKLVSISDFNPLDADPYGSALMDVFQYMIGNTDWSIVQQHNVVLLQDRNGGILPLPFDFDWTGVVDAGYAYPVAEVNIRSVRQRLYRGACLGRDTMQKVFDRFVASKQDIYAMYRSQPELDARQLKKALQYYDEFYGTITTPKDRDKKILNACRRFEKP
jgi:hypothetical protein